MTNAITSDIPLIAVVEDDPGVRVAYGDLINSHGLSTLLYSSAEEFLDAGDLDQPSCLLLDQRLPGLSGLELQSRLNELDCRVPVIFVTSQDDAATKRRALAAGAKFFFGKPVDDREMMRKILSVVGRPDLFTSDDA